MYLNCLSGMLYVRLNSEKSGDGIAFGVAGFKLGGLSAVDYGLIGVCGA